MKNATNFPGFTTLDEANGLCEFQLKSNGLKVLYQNIPGTGVVTTNITYRVGARDEMPGESGLAHMLEHMLFKPTKQDRVRGTDSGAMLFERETGVILNANTWKDRTTYYFSYPVKHFQRALTIEAERMHDVILTNDEFLPERGNVLSEFDMYNGDPSFAMAVALCATAFHSHPYGHETIGFREDIEAYTVDKLQRFYQYHYRPNNATLMVIGDIDKSTALKHVRSIFGNLENPSSVTARPNITEPKQEGVRRVDITRPGTTETLSFALKHPGFPSTGWWETKLVLSMLTEGSDAILRRLLVDTGKVASVKASLEPSYDENIAILEIALSKKLKHEAIEKLVMDIVHNLSLTQVNLYHRKLVTKTLSQERFDRDSSLDIAQTLTEYVAAGNWQAYTETEQILNSITPRALKIRLEQLFSPERMTIGYFRTTS